MCLGEVELVGQGLAGSRTVRRRSVCVCVVEQREAEGRGGTKWPLGGYEMHPKCEREGVRI